MVQVYSDRTREDDPYALPDIEIFQLSAEEAAELADEDTIMEARETLRGGDRVEMSSRGRAALISAIIEITGRQGGWYWQACFPGCLPDSEPFGPFATYKDALEDAQSV